MQIDRVAVVVPTRDRPDNLRRCLAALSRQTFEDVAIVVVDDRSVRAKDVADAVDRTLGASLVRSERRGPAAARNVGVAAAADSAIVCFTDDDCEPEPDWVASLVEALKTDTDVAVGSVENGRPDDAFSGAWHAVVDYLSQAAGVGGGAFATSNNVACLTAVAREIPFDEAYAHAAGEDRDWIARVAAAGYKVAVEPRARVVHMQTLGFRGFLRQHFRYGRGAYAFQRSRGGIEPLAFYKRLIAYAFRRGFTVGLLVVVAQVATAAGFLAERVRSR